MSFLDNTRNFGILALIVSAMQIVGAVMFFLNEDVDQIWRIIGGVGGILAAIVMLAASFAIFSGNIPSFVERLFPEGATSKFGVLTGYTSAVGMASIIGLGSSVADIVFGLIIGIIILAIVWILTNDRKGIVEKILWVVLVIVYFLGIVNGIAIIIETADSTNAFTIVSGVCLCLMYLLAFLYLFDSDVKKKFGM